MVISESIKSVIWEFSYSVFIVYHENARITICWILLSFRITFPDVLDLKEFVTTTTAASCKPGICRLTVVAAFCVVYYWGVCCCTIRPGNEWEISPGIPTRGPQPLVSFKIMNWSIEQVLTSPPTQYRLSGRQFYRSKDQTNSVKVLKEKCYKIKEKPRKKQTTQNTAKQ